MNYCPPEILSLIAEWVLTKPKPNRTISQICRAFDEATGRAIMKISAERAVDIRMIGRYLRAGGDVLAFADHKIWLNRGQFVALLAARRGRVYLTADEFANLIDRRPDLAVAALCWQEPSDMTAADRNNIAELSRPPIIRPGFEIYSHEKSLAAYRLSSGRTPIADQLAGELGAYGNSLQICNEKIAATIRVEIYNAIVSPWYQYRLFESRLTVAADAYRCGAAADIRRPMLLTSDFMTLLLNAALLANNKRQVQALALIIEIDKEGGFCNCNGAALKPTTWEDMRSRPRQNRHVGDPDLGRICDYKSAWVFNNWYRYNYSGGSIENAIGKPHFRRRTADSTEREFFDGASQRFLDAYERVRRKFSGK